MSLTINAPVAIETRPTWQAAPQAASPQPSQPQNTLVPAVEESGKSRLGDVLRKALQQMVGKSEQGDQHDGAKVFKRLAKLAHSLQKVFGEASEVKKIEGEDQIKKGALKRIEKDLGKFFREMGMPKGLARQFAHAVTDALGNGAEEVNFSFSASRSTSLSSNRQQLAYLSSGDGTTMVGAAAESLQLTAVQVQSFDFSLNLKTGELSFTSSRSADLSIESNQDYAFATDAPLSAEQFPMQDRPLPPTMEPLPALAPPEVAGSETSSLINIRQQVERSLLVKSRAASEPLATSGGEVPQSPFDTAVENMRQVVNSLDELSGQVHDLFESLVEVSNLRIEHEDGDDHLRFTVDALAPVGLSLTDQTGHATTVYPRQNGSLGRTNDPQLKGSV